MNSCSLCFGYARVTAKADQLQSKAVFLGSVKKHTKVDSEEQKISFYCDLETGQDVLYKEFIDKTDACGMCKIKV